MTATVVRGTVDRCPVFWKVLHVCMSSLSDLRLQGGSLWRRKRKEPQSLRQREEDVIPRAVERTQAASQDPH